MIILLFIFSILLLFDTAYSLFNFRYTYFQELKRRYANTSYVPIVYRMKLKIELAHEMGFAKQMVQACYIPWIVFCVFYSQWYLPVILSGVMFVSNLFYHKPYISPVVLWLNLASFFVTYCFVIGTIIIKFV